MDYERKIENFAKTKKDTKSAQLKMPQLTENERWHKVGILETGSLQKGIARRFVVAVSTICILEQQGTRSVMTSRGLANRRLRRQSTIDWNGVSSLSMLNHEENCKCNSRETVQSYQSTESVELDTRSWDTSS